jgi:ABC-type branched-subunit amino acid transport system ATPase component
VLLEVDDVVVRYGGVMLALDRVSLDVPAGGSVALLGANIAGPPIYRRMSTTERHPVRVEASLRVARVALLDQRCGPPCHAMGRS